MSRVRAVVVFAVIAVVALGSLAFAQQGDDRRGPRRGRGFGPPMGVELYGVELTDVQREHVREIVQRYTEQMRGDILLVLTPEQQEQVKQNEARREARMKERLQRMEQRRNQQ